MAYTSVKLKYYNGGQYNKSVVFYNTEQDFEKFCKMIRNATLIPKARQPYYTRNLDNLIVYLDRQYCDIGFFLNNIFNNMFISGIDLTNFIQTLSKDNATDRDFDKLEII